MTDYTPTTEEVRAAYEGQLIKIGENRFEFIDEAQAHSEFDRWLAEVKAQAWQEGWDTKPPYQEINNPYRQGEGSENSSSQPTAETSNLLNNQDAK